MGVVCGGQANPHENLVRIIDLSSSDGVLMEYWNGGDLQRYMATARRKFMPVKAILRLACQLLRAIRHLHQVPALPPFSVLLSCFLYILSRPSFVRASLLPRRPLTLALGLQIKIVHSDVSPQNVFIRHIKVFSPFLCSPPPLRVTQLPSCSARVCG